jgi:hypothetical protein
MSNLLTMAPTFSVYELRLGEVAEYTAAVKPYLVEKPAALRVFIDGSIVLAVTYLEDFLRSLVGSAARQREAALRKYLTENGKDTDKAEARTCDLIALVRMAKNRLSFRRDGASINGIFGAMFGCSPWPSDDVRDIILDLVLVRVVIVHSGSADVGIGGVGGYAKQLRRSDVFTIRSYGEFTTYRIDPLKALHLYHEALVALQSQAHHLREQLVTSTRWQGLP